MSTTDIADSGVALPPRQKFGLTTRQRQLLNFLKRTQASGVCPSYQQMMDALGLSSKSSVHRIVQGLKERGYIENLPNRARSIVIVED